MKQPISRLFNARSVAVLWASFACFGNAVAFEYTPAQTMAITEQLVRSMSGKTICAPALVEGTDVGAAIQRFGELHPERREALTNEDLYHALVTQWPCPFDPAAAGAIPATTEQVAGFWWQLAADSRRQVPAVMNPDPYPVDCAALTFRNDGRLDRLVVPNGSPCPTFRIRDLVAAPAAPTTVGWTLTAPNALTITRFDQPGFLEVWNVWTVDAPFDRSGAHFESGDLLMYLKRYNRFEDHDITLYFRHLKRVAN